MLDKKWEHNAAVYQLFIDFMKAYNLFKMEVSYSILTASGIPMELFRLIKMRLSGVYSIVKRGKHLA
jgi:hypothetical protein